MEEKQFLVQTQFGPVTIHPEKHPHNYEFLVQNLESVEDGIHEYYFPEDDFRTMLQEIFTFFEKDVYAFRISHSDGVTRFADVWKLE